MKARDIIPGWPRGRSTSSNVMSSRARYRAMGGPRIVWTIEEYALILDPRFGEDVDAELAEEARKAEMMRLYYNCLMRDAMGDFVSDIRCPWNPDWPDFIRWMGKTRQQRMKAEAEFWYSKRT